MRLTQLAFLMALFLSISAGDTFAQMGKGRMGQQNMQGMQHGRGMGMMNCPMMGRGMMMMPGMTPQQAQDYQNFQQETQQTQQQLMNDQYELNTLLNQANPDPQKVRELNLRIAETQTELQLKARKHGLTGYQMW